MIGVLEAALFLAPFVVWLAWRMLSPVLPRAALWAAMVTVAALALGAAWTASRPHLEHGQLYAPSQLRDGQIIPGHAVTP
jgi:hypothetical protein